MENNTESGPKETDKWCVNWINMAQDKDQWLLLVNTGLNFRGP